MIKYFNNDIAPACHIASNVNSIKRFRTVKLDGSRPVVNFFN